MSVTTAHPVRRQPTSAIECLDVVIIGAGFAGLGSAIRLRQNGVTQLAILERGTRIGGTWRDNHYPGAACDIPSHLYSFSFARNPNWSRGYAGAAEILDYIDQLASDHDLLPSIRFEHNVVGLRLLEDKGVWEIALEGRPPLRSRSVVMAQGPLSNASFPDIAGIDTFQGQKLLSSRWDPAFDPVGKRIGVIGTGASAIQIVPELVPTAASVRVFQRTAPWILPRPDLSMPPRAQRLLVRWPLTQRLLRGALFAGHEGMALGLVWPTPLTRLTEAVACSHLQRQVKERWLRRQLTPDYRIGCKRVLVSNAYYPALQQPNAKLVTWPIVRLTQGGVQTVEGVTHQFDAIVFATGFDVSKTGTPFPITGCDGRQLNEEWRDGAQAWRSVQVAGYPNLFLTFGPNSGPGHNSALVYMESQIDYLVRAVRHLLDHDLRLLDIRPEAQMTYHRRIQSRLQRTNWNAGCKSWYLTDEGYNGTMYPGFATQYARELAADPTPDWLQVR